MYQLTCFLPQHSFHNFFYKFIWNSFVRSVNEGDNETGKMLCIGVCLVSRFTNSGLIRNASAGKYE